MSVYSVCVRACARACVCVLMFFLNVFVVGLLLFLFRCFNGSAYPFSFFFFFLSFFISQFLVFSQIYQNSSESTCWISVTFLVTTVKSLELISILQKVNVSQISTVNHLK